MNTLLAILQVTAEQDKTPLRGKINVVQRGKARQEKKRFSPKQK